jgi:hypothetical protein
MTIPSLHLSTLANYFKKGVITTDRIEEGKRERGVEEKRERERERDLKKISSRLILSH